MKRNEKIVLHSNLIAERIGLKLRDKEYSYGRGVGRADNYCIHEDWIIVFEIEFRQRHPEMNVMKVWPYLNNYTSKRIFLIHHITDTGEVSPNRIELSNFIAGKIKQDVGNRFEYLQILNVFDSSNELELNDRLNKLKNK